MSQAPDRRVASLVQIMPRRISVFGRLGVLELNVDDEVVSLYNKSGETLFSAPVSDVEAHHWRRLLATYQFYFRLRVDGRWWYLTARVMVKYSRSATRELAKRYRVRSEAPPPPRMSPEEYRKMIRLPTTHQVLWALTWVGLLKALRNRAVAGGDPDAQKPDDQTDP